MTVLLKGTHVAEARARLLEQFKGKPRIQAFLDAFSTQTQEAENAAWSLLIKRWLSDAVGAQLDGIGEIVGEPRGGKDDATYKIYLQARILINLSSGTADELLTIVAVLVGTDKTLDFQDYWPSSFVIEVNGAMDVDAASVASLIRQARTGGVRAQLVHSATPASASLLLTDDTEDDSPTRGLADDSEDGPGGLLADVEEA